MSLFGAEFNLLSKLNDGGTNCLLEKPVAPTKCFREFSKAAEEVNDASSQFFIQESDLWNEDDKDVFEPIKTNKKKKHSLEGQGKKDEPINESFNQTSWRDNKVESPVQQETAKPDPVDEETQEGLDFDLSDCILQNPKENDIDFGLVNETDEEIVLEDSSEAVPSSPTFCLSAKSAKKSVSDNRCNFDLDDTIIDNSDNECNFEAVETKTCESDGRCNFQFSNSSLVKMDQEKSFCVPKAQVHPLGLAEKTDQWLNTVLQNEAFSNVDPDTAEEKLQNNLTFLNKTYVEILEKVMTAFENLPLDLLSQFPEFNREVFITLRTTRRRIKAIVIKTENLLKRRKERNLDCLESENEVSRRGLSADLCNSFDECRNSFKQHFSTAEGKSEVSPQYKSVGVEGRNFSSPNPEAFPCLNVEIPNSSTPLPNHGAKQTSANRSVIDYTDVLFKTPGRSCQGGNSRTNMRNDSTSGEFDGMNFPHSEEIIRKFRQKFGLKAFRPNQLQVINAALLGHDCFVLMPTGGGKSLCYQLPALVSQGVTVVISPLKSLILDQVTKLLTLDIAAAHLSGDVKESEVYMKLNQPEPKIKLLYVTPEKVGVSNALRSCLFGLYKRQKLARFIIDEAHCVSQWGHDFRPDYKKLRELRENFPDIKIMALTATATPRVRTDILHQLKVSNPKWFLSSFNRSNLVYSVTEKKGKSTVKEIAKLIQNDFRKDSGVIYCLSRNECEDVAKELKNYGVNAIAYHAGLKDTERTRVQNLWMNDKVRVVCATIAFGMGIDKLDVRFVIHFSLPKSIEGYYQESGRAGRDGEKATCILFYSYRDKHRILKLINSEQSMSTWEARKVHIDNLYRVVAYAENKTDCRRALQLEYFGEKFDRKNCLENRSTACDNCLSQGVYETIDATVESQAIVSSVKTVCGEGEKRNSNYTMLHFVDVFKGTVVKKVIAEGHDKLPLYGMGKTWQRNDVERLFRKLIMEEFLKERLLVREEGITFAYINFGRRGEELLKGNVNITFEVKKRKGAAAAQAVNVRTQERVDPAVLEIQEKCYGDLMDAIHEIASSVNCNPNAIMNVQALRAMSSSFPETEEEMLSINHVTTANFEKYGNVLLEITKKYSAEKKALQIQEVPEEEIFRNQLPPSKGNENSPYFETEIMYAGKGVGGRKRKRTYRKPPNSKKWKGSGGSKNNWGKGNRGGGGGGGGGDGSGVTTVAGAKFSSLMELPTNKARGFARPKVVLKNL